MFELPELLTLATEMNETIKGKHVREGVQGNSPHKFVWYNRKPEEFSQLVRGKVVGEATVRGRWLLLPLEPGYVLVLGDFGGRLLFHPNEAGIPAKYHLLLVFDDESALSVMTQMWGAMELFEKGKEQERTYIKGMLPTPVDPEFSFDYFIDLLDKLKGEKRSVKSLLTQDQLIPGLGNSIAQDIMFKAGLHPKHPLDALETPQKESLFNAIKFTVQAVTDEGGRYDEVDLFGNPGGYLRIMDSKSAGQPCPACGTTIEKIQYLGGACYFCPNDQV